MLRIDIIATPFKMLLIGDLLRFYGYCYAKELVGDTASSTSYMLNLSYLARSSQEKVKSSTLSLLETAVQKLM